MRSTRTSPRRLLAHRLHAAGSRAQPLSDAVGGREHRLLRPPVRPGRDGAALAHRRACCAAPGSHPFLDRPAGKLSGGMKQKLSLCCSLDPRSGAAHSRRADDRRRSAVAPAVLGVDRPHPGAPRRHERRHRDRLHGGGGAVRSPDRHGWRARAGSRHAAGDLLARTGSASLEDAFIALLPEERRGRPERASSCRRGGRGRPMPPSRRSTSP